MANKLSESSEFTIPLKNLLALVGATAVSVWAYFGIIERLTFLDRNIIERCIIHTSQFLSPHGII